MTLQIKKPLQNLFGNLTDIAIKRLRCFEENALAKSPDGFYVAYSGGKDSDVLLDLVRKSGVKHTAHYHLTTCDPPELVRHVYDQKKIEVHHPKESIWSMIRRKGFLPTGFIRYCCSNLKEKAGTNRIVVLGVRWEESTKRRARRMIETCYRNKSKQYLNTIIDWDSGDVWNHIHNNNINYCKLYDEGFKRLGCVLCPMASKRQTKIEAARWPKIARAWEKAAFDGFDLNKSAFPSFDTYWNWWMNRDWSKEAYYKATGQILKKDENQMMFFED